MLHPRGAGIPAKGKAIPLYCLHAGMNASCNYSKSTSKDSAEAEYSPSSVKYHGKPDVKIPQSQDVKCSDICGKPEEFAKTE